MSYEDYVKDFYEKLISADNFNGNYFQARVNAIVMARCYIFIKSSLEKGNKNE